MSTGNAKAAQTQLSLFDQCQYRTIYVIIQYFDELRPRIAALGEITAEWADWMLALDVAYSEEEAEYLYTTYALKALAC